jgi:hypothetical protein
MARERLYVSWPVDDAATWLEGRDPEAGAVEGEYAKVAVTCDLVQTEGLEARRGEAVEEEEWGAAWAAVFGVAQCAAVGEVEGLAVSLGHRAGMSE